MSGLGLVKGADQTQPRGKAAPRAASASSTPPSVLASTIVDSSACKPGVARGLLPTLLYSSFTLIIPLLFLFVDYDYSAPIAKAGAILVSCIAALSTVYANDCCCWYNMILFFHTALEVAVIDEGIKFASSASTTVLEMSLTITAITIVILHLVPFFVTSRVMLLGSLAFVGVIANTTVLVFLAPELLLLVGFSSCTLLATVIILGGICEVDISLFSLIRKAIMTKKCFTCSPYDV
jgi:hypothetical protein